MRDNLSLKGGREKRRAKKEYFRMKEIGDGKKI